MLPNPEYLMAVASGPSAANSNAAQTREEAILALEQYLKSRINCEGLNDKDLLVHRGLETHLKRIRAIDPVYQIQGETIGLVREAYLADVSHYPAAWSHYFTNSYGGVLDVLHGNDAYANHASQTLKGRLKKDINTAGYDYLYAYIRSVRESHEMLGLPGLNNDYHTELADWLCARLESDLAKGPVFTADEMIYDINRTLGLYDLEIAPLHRVALSALVTSNGLSILDKSFTDAAVPEAPENAKIMESTLRGLSQIGLSGKNLDCVRSTLEEAFERAAERETEVKEKLPLEQEEAGKAEPFLGLL